MSEPVLEVKNLSVDYFRIPPTGPAVLVADTDFISAMTLDRQNVFFATEGAPAGLFRVAR